MLTLSKTTSPSALSETPGREKEIKEKRAEYKCWEEVESEREERP